MYSRPAVFARTCGQPVRHLGERLPTPGAVTAAAIEDVSSAGTARAIRSSLRAFLDGCTGVPERRTAGQATIEGSTR